MYLAAWNVKIEFYSACRKVIVNRVIDLFVGENLLLPKLQQVLRHAFGETNTISVDTTG